MIPIILRADGTAVPYPPAGTTYTLEELQRAVGGYIEVIALGEHHTMVLNEEGKLRGLPPNELATLLAHLAQAVFSGDVIVGDVLVYEGDLMDGDEEEPDDAAGEENVIAHPYRGPGTHSRSSEEQVPASSAGLRDIRLAPDAEKLVVYEEVDRLYLQGNRVVMKAHPSGFPAVVIECGEIHVLTDTLSLEKWRWVKGPP